jgi:hypothetical protein
VVISRSLVPSVLDPLLKVSKLESDEVADFVERQPVLVFCFSQERNTQSGKLRKLGY